MVGKIGYPRNMTVSRGSVNAHGQSAASPSPLGTSPDDHFWSYRVTVANDRFYDILSPSVQELEDQHFRPFKSLYLFDAFPKSRRSRGRSLC